MATAPKTAPTEKIVAEPEQAPTRAPASFEDQHAMAAANISSSCVNMMLHTPDIPTVKANIPRQFTLTGDDHRPYTYYPGEGQDMRKDHAEHYYAKAHGVEIVE